VLWLDELLRDDSLRIELATPRLDLRQRGPIRWAHISDLVDPSPWLEGGEILLTTGLSIRDDPSLQRFCLQRLMASQCVALGYSLEPEGEAPAALVEEADRLGLPVFTLPHEVPLIAVTRAVAQSVIAEQYAVLEESIKLHRGVLRAILSGKGIDGLIQAAASSTPRIRYELFDAFGSPLAAHGGAPGIEESAMDRFSAATAALRHADHWGNQESGYAVEAAAIRFGDDLEAVLLGVGEHPMEPQERLFFEQTLTGVSLELARRMSLREERRARVSELLEEVFSQVFLDAEMTRRMEGLGLSPSRPLRVLCVRYPPSVPQKRLAALLEDVLSGEPNLVGSVSGYVYAIFPAHVGEAAREFFRVARTRKWPVSIGRSTSRAGASELVKLLQEARLAAAAATPGHEALDVSGLGVAGVVATLYGSPVADAFIDQTLGPLLVRHDEDGGYLLETLKAFLARGCRTGPTALDLHVHRHTLTYRLERIFTLSGRDPRSGEGALAFGLALSLLEQRQGNRRE
jgi:purine catabolism regulator